MGELTISGWRRSENSPSISNTFFSNKLHEKCEKFTSGYCIITISSSDRISEGIN